jgi:hypothetical protein
MTPILKDNYQRWLKKSKKYNGHSLANYFDEFFTLFVAYNILYGEVWRRSYGAKWVKDKKAATTDVVKFLSDSYVLLTLSEPRMKEHIDEIISQLAENFYVIDSESDRKLIESIQSGEKNRFGKAVLELLYGIRCNMFHGKKGFEQDQTEILIPAIKVLRKINEILFIKLDA